MLDKNKLCRGVNRWNKNCKAQNIVDNLKNKNNILYLLALLHHQNVVLLKGKLHWNLSNYINKT